MQGKENDQWSLADLFVLYALHLIVKTFIEENKNIVFKVIKI
jgi:hypothetical protein